MAKNQLPNSYPNIRKPIQDFYPPKHHSTILYHLFHLDRIYNKYIPEIIPKLFTQHFPYFYPCLCFFIVVL